MSVSPPRVVLTLSLFLLVAAAICFVVALLLATSVFSGSNQTAWMIGGLLSLTLSFLVA